MSNSLKIGELAKRTGCLVETIRYYEREGLLLEPARSEGNYRLYTDIHVERLQFIRHCRVLDMTLEEIRNLLRFRDAPDENCREVNALDKFPAAFTVAGEKQEKSVCDRRSPWEHSLFIRFGREKSPLRRGRVAQRRQRMQR